MALSQDLREALLPWYSITLVVYLQVGDITIFLVRYKMLIRYLPPDVASGE